jgi:hypothetical protein
MLILRMIILYILYKGGAWPGGIRANIVDVAVSRLTLHVFRRSQIHIGVVHFLLCIRPYGQADWHGGSRCSINRLNNNMQQQRQEQEQQQEQKQEQHQQLSYFQPTGFLPARTHT